MSGWSINGSGLSNPSSPHVKCQTLISSRCAAAAASLYCLIISEAVFTLFTSYPAHSSLSHGSLTSVIEHFLLVATLTAPCYLASWPSMGGGWPWIGRCLWVSAGLGWPGGAQMSRLTVSGIAHCSDSARSWSGLRTELWAESDFIAHLTQLVMIAGDKETEFQRDLSWWCLNSETWMSRYIHYCSGLLTFHKVWLNADKVKSGHTFPM